MASAKGQVGRAIINKLAKRSTASAKKAVGRKVAVKNLKAVAKGVKPLINKGLKTTALNIRAGVRKVGAKAGVLAGTNVKKAMKGGTRSADLKNIITQTARTKTARKKVAKVAAGAGIAAAGAGAAYAKSKSSSKNTGSKVKSAASTAKRKVQAGYKMVYGKLKRVRSGG